jgi:hypothetical protein
MEHVDGPGHFRADRFAARDQGRFKEVVYKQVEQQGVMSPKKKLDEGIDIIFKKVKLTTEKPKDLEKWETTASTAKEGEH